MVVMKPEILLDNRMEEGWAVYSTGWSNGYSSNANKN